MTFASPSALFNSSIVPSSSMRSSDLETLMPVSYTHLDVYKRQPYYYGANNTVMVHIRNLRKKIEDDANKPGVIKTVWGKGYRCD